MLIHWDGLSLNEAAELLNINPSTARSKVRNCSTTTPTDTSQQGPVNFSRSAELSGGSILSE